MSAAAAAASMLLLDDSSLLRSMGACESAAADEADEPDEADEAAGALLSGGLSTKITKSGCSLSRQVSTMKMHRNAPEEKE